MKKRKFDILTDSGCDMPSHFLESYNVACVRLGYTMQNVSYEGECGQRLDEREFYKKLRDGGYKAKLVMQVHDELIIDTLISEQAQVEKLLVEEMEGAVDLAVKLTVSLGSGKTWFDAK